MQLRFIPCYHCFAFDSDGYRDPQIPLYGIRHYKTQLCYPRKNEPHWFEHTDIFIFPFILEFSKPIKKGI